MFYIVRYRTEQGIESYGIHAIDDAEAKLLFQLTHQESIVDIVEDC